VGFGGSVSIPHLSLQYVGVPVKTTLLTGAAYNPTSDAVQMAFMPTPTQVPQITDWQTAIWSAVTGNVVYPYAAYCLVGPGGTINPGIGNYIIYLKVTDNPEVPVIIAGQLEIS
jgi:hypothetical protein